MTTKQITSIVLLGASIIYDVVPTDFIPDIPLIGWLDDFLVTSSALMNCIQQFSPEDTNKLLTKLLQWFKWIFILLAILIILVVVLLASTIMTLFK